MNFFGWPLEDYTFSGEHLVSVEVEDILGFRSISPPRNVMVTVESLYPAWITAFLKFFNLGGWILFAVLGLGAAAFAGVRVQRRIQARAQMPEQGLNPEEHVDPLHPICSGTVQRRGNDAAGGYQAPIYSIQGESGTSAFSQAAWSTSTVQIGKLDITEGEQIIGSDPEQASIVLLHPSVSPTPRAHTKNPSGNVTIADLRSHTGTWVNYTPISPIGTVLKDGDLVKIGDFSFRYYLGMGSGDIQ